MKQISQLEYYYCVYRNLINSGLEKGDVDFFQISGTQVLIWKCLQQCKENKEPLICDLTTKTVKEACIIRLHFLINGYKPKLESSGLVNLKLVMPIPTQEELERNLAVLKDMPFTYYIDGE